MPMRYANRYLVSLMLRAIRSQTISLKDTRSMYIISTIFHEYTQFPTSTTPLVLHKRDAPSRGRELVLGTGKRTISIPAMILYSARQIGHTDRSSGVLYSTTHSTIAPPPK